MRLSQEILESLNVKYDVKVNEYYDGLSAKQCKTFIIDNYIGTQIFIMDVLDGDGVIRYEVDFWDTCDGVCIDGYMVESEHELEDIIKGFTG